MTAIVDPRAWLPVVARMPGVSPRLFREVHGDIAFVAAANRERSR
jgi:hypothetical protein